MILAWILGSLSCAVWLTLLTARGGFWRITTDRDLPPGPAPAAWPAVTAVVPARDEAVAIGACIRSLVTQDYPGPFRVVLVDDHSSDGTANLARTAAAESRHAERLEVVGGRALPAGWTGKLWAVAQGIDRAADAAPDAAPDGAPPRYLWLSDADIEHPRDGLRRLVARAEAGGLDLVSLMVRLRCKSLAERALVPAFVFFFRMLYPFAWINDPAAGTAGAAGGCMLVRREALAAIGGFGAIRGALIDDCTLGAALKSGGPIRLDLADDTRSLRDYDGFGEIWRMIARSAYTQLDHSPLLLALCGLGMIVTYLVPPALALSGLPGWAPLAGAAAWAAMALAYWPTLHYYRLSPLWAPLLPLIALFYLGATLDSARRHWLGRGGEWKGRAQAAR